jgi:hypothetical protein
MAVAPTAAYGTLLKEGNGDDDPGPETYDTIAKVSDIAPPELLREVDEITNHSGSGWKEFLPTLKELAEFTITVIWDSDEATHSSLTSSLTGGTLKNYQLVFTDTGAETWTFAAYILRIKKLTPIDGANRAEVTVRPTAALS